MKISINGCEKSFGLFDGICEVLKQIRSGEFEDGMRNRTVWTFEVFPRVADRSSSDAMEPVCVTCSYTQAEYGILKAVLANMISKTRGNRSHKAYHAVLMFALLEAAGAEGAEGALPYLITSAEKRELVELKTMTRALAAALDVWAETAHTVDARSNKTCYAVLMFALLEITGLHDEERFLPFIVAQAEKRELTQLRTMSQDLVTALDLWSEDGRTQDFHVLFPEFELVAPLRWSAAAA